MRLHTHSEDCSICGDYNASGDCGVPLKRGRSKSPAGEATRGASGIWNGERRQEVGTPQWVLDALSQEWGAIGRDPCSDAGCMVDAESRYIFPEQDGLALPWCDRTYANPPYGDLKSWLAKAVAESCEGYRIAALAPIRCHRAWYRDALDTVSAAVELPALIFKGYTQAFPAALHLLCWNWTPSPRLWRGTVRKMVRVT